MKCTRERDLTDFFPDVAERKKTSGLKGLTKATSSYGSDRRID
jgi:hypothetical protein